MLKRPNARLSIILSAALVILTGACTPKKSPKPVPSGKDSKQGNSDSEKSGKQGSSQGSGNSSGPTGPSSSGTQPPVNPQSTPARPPDVSPSATASPNPTQAPIQSPTQVSTNSPSSGKVLRDIRIDLESSWRIHQEATMKEVSFLGIEAGKAYARVYANSGVSDLNSITTSLDKSALKVVKQQWQEQANGFNWDRVETQRSFQSQTGSTQYYTSAFITTINNVKYFGFARSDSSQQEASNLASQVIKAIKQK